MLTCISLRVYCMLEDSLGVHGNFVEWFAFRKGANCKITILHPETLVLHVNGLNNDANNFNDGQIRLSSKLSFAIETCIYFTISKLFM